MKKFLYSLSVCLALVSCIGTKQSELEKQAIETLKMSLLEDNKDVTIDNIKTVFICKNLCILNADISGIRDLNKVEYLFLTLDGKCYEALHDLNDDNIFVNETTYNKICKGKIYENQDYTTSILFRSIEYLNAYGREVGNHNEDYFINSPLKTGLWEICDIADEFGDITEDKCLRIIGRGTYSSDYESNKRLIALLFIYKNGIVNIQLFKDNKKIDNFSGRLKIKDAEEDIHEIYFTSDHLGQIEPSNNVDKVLFRDIIEKEGKLSAIANTGGWLFSEKKSYKFKFNLDGLEKAMKYLKHNSSDYNYDEDEIESENSISLSEEEYEEVKNKIKFNVELDSVKEESDVLK